MREGVAEEAGDADRDVDPRARICHIDPVIHIEPDPGSEESRIATVRHNAAQFEAWESQHPDEPFGQVAIAASYLFEEFYRQGVLTSDFFLNEKKFLHGIDGEPDPVRMESFETAIQKARELASERLAKDPRDPEALYALTLSAGMESDADMILRKHNLDALHRLKEANAHAKALLAERPDAKDVYLALGSANYIIGSLSMGFRAMLWFGGIFLALFAVGLLVVFWLAGSGRRP